MTVGTGDLDAAKPQQAHDGVEVSAILDVARFGAVQLTVLVFTFFALVMDGFDIQAIAFAAPALTEAWGIDRSTLGPVFSAALFGMAFGAAGIGPFGDRYGRKTALIASCAFMAVGSLASAFTTGPVELAVFRLITGIGLGGAMPNATALMFEFAPKAWRQIATSTSLVGVLIGGMFGAALARDLIPIYGWRSLFVVGGIIPAVLALLMWALLPESPRFLSGQASKAGTLAKLLNRITGSNQFTAATHFATGSAAKVASSPIAAIFLPEHRRDTLVLWVILFTNVFSVYFFFNWLPTVLAAAQLDFTLAVTGSFVFNLGGVIGALLASFVMGRYGSRVVLGFAGGIAVLSVIGIGMNHVFAAERASDSLVSLMATMAVAGACINALQIGMFSVAAHVYPTFCRSTGVGWALAVARFGGIVSAFAGAGFFALGLPTRTFFFVIAGMLTLAFFGVLALRRHMAANRQGIPG